MQATLRRLASSATELPMPMSVQEASVQLVPPIPLYRRILRAHRALPADMRFMGDAYVKSEFRLTRKADNPLHIVAFLGQWKIYLDEIERSAGPGWKGKKLDMSKLETMNKEQVGQLYELMHAAKDVWKSPEQLEQEARNAGVEGLPEPADAPSNTKKE